MTALLLIHKDSDGSVTNMPFVYKSGEMMAVIEEIVDYIVGLDLVDSVWEAIAADRLRIILEQKVKLQEAAEAVKEAHQLAEMWMVGPLKEVAR